MVTQSVHNGRDVKLANKPYAHIGCMKEHVKPHSRQNLVYRKKNFVAKRKKKQKINFDSL